MFFSFKEELNIFPAYGRKYGSAEAAYQDWVDGKDFRIGRGPYLSNRDREAIREDGYSAVILWWGRGLNDYIEV